MPLVSELILSDPNEGQSTHVVTSKGMAMNAPQLPGCMVGRMKIPMLERERNQNEMDHRNNDEIAVVEIGRQATPLQIRIRELPFADGVAGSTGGQLWCSGRVLAEEVLQFPDRVRGRRVIELGAGCGLLGMVVARVARWTLLTDGDEEVVRNLQYNLDLNSALWRLADGEEERELSVQRLPWDDIVAGDGWPPEERADVVLSSDTLFGSWGDTLAQAMLKVLAPGGLVMVVVPEDRRIGVAGFLEVMQASGYAFSETLRQSDSGEFRLYEGRSGLPLQSNVCGRGG